MDIPAGFKAMVGVLECQEPRVTGLVEALETTSPSVAVRFNSLKCRNIPSVVAGVPVGEIVKWCERGRYLTERPMFTFDPALHQGTYYVQDASSMFLNHVIASLGLSSPVTYLDACAAPGGKTTAAIDALPGGSLVVANEWDYRRAEILKENVMKWGCPDVVVSRGDTARFRKLKDTFDIIAADVPCSGEGMMRKDIDAVTQWSEGLVSQCVSRQQEIVTNLWSALKPGGYFIYSTCTFNRSENEEMVSFLIDEVGAEPVNVCVDGMPEILPGIATPYPCYRFMPHRVNGEGLFMAVLRKGGSTLSRPEKEKQAKSAKIPLKLPAWFPCDLMPRIVDGTLYGLPAMWATFIDRLGKSVDVILQGVEVGIIKGRDIIPSQGLALSGSLDCGSVPEVEVDRETALCYLRRDVILLPEDTPRGYVLVKYDGRPLGWVKNIGNRCNNLYPTAWRILKR